MLVDPTNDQEIQWNRPSVVTATHFIHERCSNGQLKVLAGNFCDEASDQDFKQFLIDHDNDFDAAIENYRLSFTSEAALDMKSDEGTNETATQEAKTQEAPANQAQAPKEVTPQAASKAKK